MPDTLALWSYSADVRVIEIDLQSPVAPRSSEDYVYRAKNRSTVYTAHNIEVSFSGDASEWLVSLDGEVYTSSVNIGDLEPLALSGAIWLRRVTPSDASIGGRGCTLNIVAESWS